jgi:hypothetical protein
MISIPCISITHITSIFYYCFIFVSLLFIVTFPIRYLFSCDIIVLLKECISILYLA